MGGGRGVLGAFHHLNPSLTSTPNIVKTPRLREAAVRDILDANKVPQGIVSIVAIRGYYLNSMGRPGRNDRRIYDDAMFVCSPSGVIAFQANTDPNGYRKGYGYGSKKGMACLKKGIHRYAIGPHKGRAAFRQAEPFTVIRDGNPPYPHKGWHAINLHSGGWTSTSSLGCQTIPRAIWSTFRKLVYQLLEDHENPFRKNDWKQLRRSFDYVLIEEADRRDGNLVVSSRYGASQPSKQEIA